LLNRFADSPRGHVKALIVTPTRELAAQIDEARRDLGKNTKVKGAAIFGGVGMRPQETALRNGVDILVATPGRLLDHLQNPYANLDQVEVVVLDEADRMLDMGFLPDVKRIFSHLPKNRQTLFFSATMPDQIARLAGDILKNPVVLQIQRKSAPAEAITQAVWPVPQDLKTSLLLELLNRGEIDNVLVFTRTKHRANRVAEWLGKRGINAARIHGNRSQSQRTEALDGFKKGRYRVLVATDVAARGIDIEALPHVVNFDVPGDPDSYIHRVGRTARAERTGHAWTFFSPQERNDLNAIERAVGHRIVQEKLEGFDYNSRSNEKLEIPIQDRIAAIRARKSADRKRSAEKARRKTENGGGSSATSARPARKRQGAGSGTGESRSGRSRSGRNSR
ncbi:MAG: DEAD/DEAH box helicase, partial [Thermoanaerobaculia bacterium]|nr:DEAD/DEAH box helicase [Thermoanaerobaculia bacterium]